MVGFTCSPDFRKAIGEWTRTGSCSGTGSETDDMYPMYITAEPTYGSPARKRSVGMALYGPAMVLCNALDSSLSVASSGADMDPIYPSTDNA